MLKNCNECKGPVLELATSCPHCGLPLAAEVRSPSWNRRTSVLLYVLLITGICIFFTSGFWWWLKGYPISPSDYRWQVGQIPGPIPRDRRSVYAIIGDVNVPELFQERGVSDQEITELSSTLLLSAQIPIIPSEKTIHAARGLLASTMASTGLRTTESVRRTYNASYEDSIRAVVTGLALSGVTIKMVGDTPKGGILICAPPNNLTNWGNNMTVQFQTISAAKTSVIIDVDIIGKENDWGGENKSLINDIHHGASRYGGIVIEL